MKRNAIVVVLVVITLGLLAWAGYTNYRLHKLADQMAAQHDAQKIELVPVGPQSTTTPAAAGSNDSTVAPNIVGKPAPEFTLDTPAGPKLVFADFRKQHKAVMINFWATWCVPCKVEMPWLIDLEKKYSPQGFEILGISVDDPPTAADKVKAYAAKIGAGYPMALDPDQHTADHFGVQNFPTSYYVAADGTVVAQTEGLVSKDEIESDIKKALAGAK